VRAGAKLNKARRLRIEQTEVEKRLWSKLRDRRLLGVKFRRQVPVGPYIADFACIESFLIVELDGGQHSSMTSRDAARTARFQRDGWRVMRFWNNEVVENMEGVLETIATALAARPSSPHPTPLPQAGEGVFKSQAGLWTPPEIA
jgi:very-short-patch-repair endonuclease